MGMGMGVVVACVDGVGVVVEVWEREGGGGGVDGGGGGGGGVMVAAGSHGDAATCFVITRVPTVCRAVVNTCLPGPYGQVV